MPTFVEIHAIHTVGPSCINRDGDGTPKVAKVGGKLRSRVSSQAWKRAMRRHFHDVQGLESGVLSRRYRDEIARLTVEANPDLDVAAVGEGVEKLFAVIVPKKTEDSKTLAVAFYSPAQLQGAAALMPEVMAALSEAPETKSRSKKKGGTDAASKLGKELVGRAVEALTVGMTIDQALFGRMMAGNASLGVDAAAQVAHAIGVDEFAMELDYFTTVDDLNGAEEDEEGAGSAHLGEKKFGSATLYRYANVNVDDLARNLAGNAEAAREAVPAFVEAFVLSMPTGSQNAYANRTRPEMVRIIVRTDQPVSLVAAFNRPVSSGEVSIPDAAIERLLEFEARQDAMYGTGRIVWSGTAGTAGGVSYDELIDGVKAALA